jgi:hypothetical protein
VQAAGSGSGRHCGRDVHPHDAPRRPNHLDGGSRGFSCSGRHVQQEIARRDIGRSDHCRDEKPRPATDPAFVALDVDRPTRWGMKPGAETCTHADLHGVTAVHPRVSPIWSRGKPVIGRHVCPGRTTRPSDDR